MSNISKITVGNTTYDIEDTVARERNVELSNDIKSALLTCFTKVAWIDADGQDYYDALYEALYARVLVSITATYTQSGTVYDTDSLDSLKSDLVVVANYNDSSTETLASTDYTLSGTLTAGTSTVTVTYLTESTTFNVTVTHIINGWYYPFNGSLASLGTKDFGLQWLGTASYATGRDGVSQCYFHDVETEGTASTDKGSVYANGFTAPDFSGDFTIGFWEKSVTNGFGQLISPFTVGTSSSNATQLQTPTNVASGWTVVRQQISKQVQGMRMWFSAQGTLQIRLINKTLANGSAYTVTLPASVDTTQWHHYALTRTGSTIRFFFDGAVIFTLSNTSNIRFDTQISIGSYFSSAGDTVPVQTGRGNYFQDLYIAEYCKWDSAFDPNEITY